MLLIFSTVKFHFNCLQKTAQSLTSKKKGKFNAEISVPEELKAGR